MAFRQSIEVRPDPDFHNDATRLVSALQAIFDPSAVDVPETMAASAQAGRRAVAWIVAAAVGLAAAALAIPAGSISTNRRFRKSASEINTADTDRPLDFALSPDGRQIAYVAADEGVNMLWLRSLDSGDARPLPGTTMPWLPSGHRIAHRLGTLRAPRSGGSTSRAGNPGSSCPRLP